MAVVPTFREVDTVEACVERIVHAAQTVAVIVSDCHSDDGTREAAARAGAIVVQGEGASCRAHAINAGVDAAIDRFATAPAAARAIWIVHADSIPPSDAGERILETIKHEGKVGGAFAFRFETAGQPMNIRLRLRLVEMINRLRYRITGIYFGDQGIFFRASAWRRVRPLPDWALMEDAELSRRLQRLGKLVLLPREIKTSPRRFLHHGPIAQLTIDVVLIVLHGLGVNPRRLARMYRWYNRRKG